MSQSPNRQREPPASIPLRVVLARQVDLDAARLALTDPGWLGRPADGPGNRPDLRRVAADLELPILDGSAARAVRKAALIDVGKPRLIGDELTATIAWRSATMAPLFPVFAGELRIAVDGLVLQGRYAPPLGSIGLLMDGTLLRFVARRTAQAFLTRVSDRIAR